MRAIRGRPLPTRRSSPVVVAPIAAGLLLTSVVAAPAQAQEPRGATAGFDRLDFWVGEWEVFVGDRQVGTNRIAKILDGCDITEEWKAATGGEGRSLFYHLPRTDEWKQVWVTSTATRTGGVKEKSLVEVLDDGALRFQGRIPDAAGELWYDRTTLMPLPDGNVRQVIEVSRDGETWETTFDALYVRRGRDDAR